MIFKKKLLSLLILSLLIFSFGGTVIAQQQAEKQPQNWYDNLIFKDQSLTFEFIRTLGYSYEGGADLGECIETARLIKEGDDESWYNEWSKTADRVYNFAQKCEKDGHIVSAREAYLRASNYYRTAGFYMDAIANRAKSIECGRKSKISFLKAIASLPYIKPVKIPYENTTLPGYFLKTPYSKQPAPLLIVQTGFDGTKEELFFDIGLAAMQRGYNCLIFEGPGQGEVLRVQNLHFRPDWEKVVTHVVDYALSRKDVDKNKIALMGLSFGGYLAPRAAAFEHRIKACIANGGVYDFAESQYKLLPPEIAKLIEIDPEKFNEIIEKVMVENTTARWAYNNGMWAFDTKSPADFMLKIRDYTLKNVVKKIKCRMLVIDSADDIFMKGQAEKLYQELNCPRDFILFTVEETAQAHCQMGATAISNEIIFNWLDSVFSK